MAPETLKERGRLPGRLLSPRRPTVEDRPSVVLVVPCYNEADRLDRASFLAFAAENRKVGFLFVNDGSADDTSATLDDLQKSNPRQIMTLQLTQNRGKAEAVRLGVLSALEADVSFVGYWDADLATPLEELPRFLEEAKAHPWADIIIGSRVRLLGRSIDRSPTRHFLGRLFATAASLALTLPVYDTQCGAKLFRNTPLLRRVFSRPFQSRWIFDVEVLARFMAEAADRLTRKGVGASIQEIPLMDWADVPGSKVKPMDFAVSFFELLKLRRAYKRRRAAAQPGWSSRAMWSQPEFDRRTGSARRRKPSAVSPLPGMSGEWSTE